MKTIGKWKFSAANALDLIDESHDVFMQTRLLGWWYGSESWEGAPGAPHERVEKATRWANKYVADPQLTDYGRDAMREVLKALKGGE